MKIFQYEIKDKLDKKYIFGIYFIHLGLLLFYHWASPVGSTYLQHFQIIQKSAIFSFVCMMFVAYEIFADLQNIEWRELMDGFGTGKWKLPAAKNMLLICMVGMVFAVVSGVDLGVLSGGEQFSLLSKHVARVDVLNFGLIPLTGAFLGKMFAACCKKRWAGYLGVLIISLLGCGMLHRISISLYNTIGWNMDSIFRFFQFVQPNCAWAVDYIYLVPVESYRFFLFFGWIAGAECFTCLYMIKKRIWKNTAAALCIAVCVCLFIQVVCAKNYLNFDLNYGSPVTKETEFEADESVPEKAADFSIDKYQMRLCFDDELSAEADLILSNQQNTGENKQYCFTLYRGYVITEISDGHGNVLSYERDKDYITVYSGDVLEQIHMTYHGHSQTFYSNTYAVMLPGFFAYYPQAGFRTVFCQKDGMSGFNTIEDTLSPSEFQIRADCKKPIYSNLNEDDGVFYGTTSAPTFVAGLVSREITSDGTYIFPTLLDNSKMSLPAIKEQLEQVCEEIHLSADNYNQIQYVISVPSTVYMDNYRSDCICVDHCLFLNTQQWLTPDPERIADEIIKHELDLPKEKVILADIMMDVLRKAMYLADLSPMSEEDFLAVSYDETDQEMIFYSDFTIEKMYVTLIEQYGQEAVIDETVAYLLDQNTTDNLVEFLKRLYQKLEVLS